jgi:histidinol-phosphate/aromatic aminotransferase/cobyric acid decarboxylase-like protein
VAEPSLALSSYAGLRLSDREDVLNLAWTSDENAFLDADLGELIRTELTAEVGADLPWVRTYPVTDPYGAAALGPAVAAYFGLAEPLPGLVCGAGVGPVLHGLARLARGGAAGVLGHVYPDFPYWVHQVGGRCVRWSPADPVPPVLFLERPALLGDTVPLEALRELSARCLVVVDESNANYCAPSYSAVTLVPHAPNLVVLRGLSKAYGLGGLRLSYCAVGSAALDAVRASVPPLLTSTLSLRIGARVLLAGDLTAGLRDRIAAARPEALALLRDAGIEPTAEAAAPFPYLLFTDPAGPAGLAAAGVRGKRHLFWNGEQGALFRVSVPLLPTRMAELAHRLAAR